jgi:hypothetical protein
MENEIFSAIIAAIRQYIIKMLAEQVSQDIIANGLSDDDMATIATVMNEQTPAGT